MHPQSPYQRSYSYPRRPFHAARRANEPAESATPAPPRDASPPLRIPRSRRPEHSSVPSNTTLPRQQANYIHHAVGATGVAIARKPVGSAPNTSRGSGHARADTDPGGKRRPAASVSSETPPDKAGEALPGALPESGQTLTADGAESVLSSSSWSRVVEAASMDSATLTVGSNEAVGTVSSGATVRSNVMGPGVQSQSRPRAGPEMRLGLDGEDNESSAMTEKLAELILQTATENLVRVRVLGLWSIKILVGLYLATCLWSVVTAVGDAVVRLIARVLTFGGFLLWIFGVF